MPPRAERDRVLAFRFAGHNLARAERPGALLDAAGACGLQNTPPGSAALALAARVPGLGPAAIDRALGTDRTLLQVRSLRGAPYVFPTRDAPVFTAGLIPEDEAALRFFILGAGPALDKVGLSATELVERASAALLDVLDGRTLPFRQLSSALTEQLSRQLTAQQLAAWRSSSWYAPGQSLGEALVHFALYPVALRGLYCYAPRESGEASFVRSDQWLGEPLPRVDQDGARAALVRRFLRCYGPSTAAHFGEWAGIAPAAAERAWRLVASELVAMDCGGRPTWLHEGDRTAFESAPPPAGVRLLPPHDPYLAQRDRETLLPDKTLHRMIWRTIGNPGVVLADGRIVALWRPKKQGKRLLIAVEPLSALAAPLRDEIAAEAALVAPFRGCAATETVFSC
jgi:hypothetical protein